MNMLVGLAGAADAVQRLAPLLSTIAWGDSDCISHGQVMQVTDQEQRSYVAPACTHSRYLLNVSHVLRRATSLKDVKGNRLDGLVSMASIMCWQLQAIRHDRLCTVSLKRVH
eukprot:jgi/Ulvmu1/2524/UM138_0029.1